MYLCWKRLQMCWEDKWLQEWERAGTPGCAVTTPTLGTPRCPPLLYTVCVYAAANVCTCVISITTCGAMFGEPLSRLCGVRSLASALTHPGLCSINTFTSPGCGWAFINSLEGSGTTRSKVSLFLSAFACPLFSSICHDLDFSFFFLRALAVEQYTQGYMSSNDNVMNFTCEKTNLYWTWRSNYTE